MPDIYKPNSRKFLSSKSLVDEEFGYIEFEENSTYRTVIDISAEVDGEIQTEHWYVTYRYYGDETNDEIFNIKSITGDNVTGAEFEEWPITIKTEGEAVPEEVVIHYADGTSGIGHVYEEKWGSADYGMILTHGPLTCGTTVYFTHDTESET